MLQKLIEEGHAISEKARARRAEELARIRQEFDEAAAEKAADVVERLGITWSEFEALLPEYGGDISRVVVTVRAFGSSYPIGDRDNRETLALWIYRANLEMLERDSRAATVASGQCPECERFYADDIRDADPTTLCNACHQEWFNAIPELVFDEEVF